MALDPSSSERPRTPRPGTRIGVCVSRFHDELTGAMLRSAKGELATLGVAEDDVVVAWVPGTFELPLVAKRLAQRSDVDAVIALGLVLKGETRHDVVVADSAASALARVALDCEKPVLLGVLTCATLDQARARALPVAEGGKEDKGREVARAAIDVLHALDGLEPRLPEMGFRASLAPGSKDRS